MQQSNMYNTPPPRQIDISSLQDYKIDTKQDWTDWQFRSQQYDHIPLGISNKFHFFRNLRYCDLSSLILQNTQEQLDFVVVEENIKKKNKDFISKNQKMSDYAQAANTRRYNVNKKWQKFSRGYTTQIKTNFKKITVKNDWAQIQTIKKNSLEQISPIKNLKIQNIKTVGQLYEINPQIDRINWQEVKFRQNKVYTVEPVKTADDPQLTKIVQKLMQEQQTDRVNIICHPSFLLALLTVRASVYPWNIEIQKSGNLIVLENFKNSEDESQKLNYLDLFTTNENTTNNMPIQQAKLKQTCIAATKMTKVFKDLLVSGDKVDREDIEHLYPQNGEQQAEAQEGEQGQQGEQQEKKQGQQLEKIRKYIKISFDKIDIYTFVQIDGVKRNSTTGNLELLLVRTFMESESQGKWIKDMKTPGTLITKQYHSNTCNIQKWICQARLAGVQEIKTGYIGIGSNKTPVLLNVQGISVKSLQSTLSFKYQNCWSAARYILNLLVGLQDGNYVLSKSPYTPLSIKLYKTSSAQDQNQDDKIQQEDEEQQGQEEDGQEQDQEQGGTQKVQEQEQEQ